MFGMRKVDTCTVSGAVFASSQPATGAAPVLPLEARSANCGLLHSGRTINASFFALEFGATDTVDPARPCVKHSCQPSAKTLAQAASAE
jgi:hypothetical protein